MTTPRDAIAGHPSLIDEIRYLASPDAERMSDFQRINRFVTVGCEAATALDALQARVKELEVNRDHFERLYRRTDTECAAAESRATSAEQERDEALERAAKMAEQHAWSHPSAGLLGPEMNSMEIAAAIRRLAAGTEKKGK